MTVGWATFTVGEDAYLYDTATNGVVSLPPAAAALLPDQLRDGARAALRAHRGRWPAAELRDAAAFLRACRAQGMLRRMGRVDYLAAVRPAALRPLYARGPRRLTLGLTERCNQRCGYCPFGGAARGAPRGGEMSWETARRAIDRFLATPAGRRAPTLELFGGEPLLRWPLVERILRHVREVRRRRDVELVLYTNATLLDPARLRTLMAHRVVVQISLDGPARVHDRARLLAGGGPTHAEVLRALARIRRADPAYLRRHVRLHCTFGLDGDLTEVFRYFARPALRGLQISFGYRAGGARPSPADRARHEAQLEAIDRWHLRALRAGRPFPRALYASLLAASLEAVATRQAGRAGRVRHPNGACLPGQERVFADGEGALHPCENVCQPGTEIGDATVGVDAARAAALLRRHAELCQRMCQGCWASRLCSQCLLHSLGPDGRPAPAKKAVACRAERAQILAALRRWVRLWQAEPAWAARVKGTLRHAATG